MATNFRKLPEGGQSYIPRTADPASPANGDIQFSDGTARAEGLWQYKSGAWSLVSPTTLSSAIRATTTTDTILSTDDVVLASSAGGAHTLTLPTAVGITGHVIRFKKTTTDFSIITIDGDGTETITENSTATTTTTLNTIGEQLEIVSDGSNWVVISRTIPAVTTSFTPTGGWSTNTTYTGRYTRDGAYLELVYVATLAGAPNAATLSLNIPFSLTIDTARLTSGNTIDPLGTIVINDASGSGTGRLVGIVLPNNTTSVNCHGFDEAAASDHYSVIVNATAPITFASTDTVTAKVRVPISGWKE